MSASVRKILAVAGRVRAGSGFLHMLDLLQGLSAQGFSVSLLCGGLPVGIGARRISFPVHTWSEMAGRWPSRRGEAALERLVRRTKVQLVHVHGTQLGWAGRWFVSAVNTPMVFTPHSASSHVGEISRLQRRCGRIIALSEALREGLVNRCRVPREKVAVVPPGLPVGSYEVAGPLARHGGWPADRVPIVGMAAPLARERGQEVFLDAAKKLLAAGRGVKFIMAGDGPTERALRRRVRRLELDKHVIFVTGFSAYRDIIPAMDIFVRPALAAGIGYIVLEAMAMAKPVVVTSTKGVVYLVEDERSGLVVAKRDAEALAEAVGKLLADPAWALQMGLAARERVVEKFGMDRLVADTLEVYAKAAAAKPVDAAV